jgi:outer membrane protein
MFRSLAIVVLTSPVWAQGPLSLDDAVRIALEKHPSVAASQYGTQQAGARIQEARSGYLPRVNYTESLTRSNNPVFVFGSLLEQHQFTAANFALGPLNRPEPLDNFQSLITGEQTVYDFGATKANVKSAELGRDISREDERRTKMDLIRHVAGAYHGAQLAAEALRVAEEATKSAEADLKQAEAIRAAGLSTEADVLSLRVHLASMREQQIRRRADFEVASAALNEALGLPLTESHTLTTPLTAASLPPETVQAYERQSVDLRPEMRQARLATDLAETGKRKAHAALLPRISLRGAYEVDRQTFGTKVGTNWLAGAALQWNAFDGLASWARRDEAAYAMERAQALQDQARAQVQLQVRRAYADYQAAREQVDVASAAVAEARESLRITKNRYENGLSTVTDLLRTETASLEASNRHLAALYNQRMAAVNLELAAGTLSPASEALK